MLLTAIAAEPGNESSPISLAIEGEGTLSLLTEMVNCSQKFYRHVDILGIRTYSNSASHAAKPEKLMSTSLLRNSDYKVYTLFPTYENVHALLAEIHIYVFDREGRLVDSQSVRRGKAAIAASVDELVDARIVISPLLNEGQNERPTLEEVRLHYVFETALKFEPDRFSYELPHVPETIWRWWLVHSLWKNVREISAKKTGLLLW